MCSGAGDTQREQTLRAQPETRYWQRRSNAARRCRDAFASVASWAVAEHLIGVRTAVQSVCSSASGSSFAVVVVVVVFVIVVVVFLWGGKIGREVLDEASKAVRVGATTDEIDRVVSGGGRTVIQGWGVSSASCPRRHAVRVVTWIDVPHGVML